MAKNRWTNKKGVKFVGQTSSVPAPEYKAPDIIEYSELHDIGIVMTPRSIPSQTNNTSPQIITIDAIVNNAGSPVTTWDYDLFFRSVGEISLEIRNTINAPPSGSVEAIFPTGVQTGKTGIIKAYSGSATGILKITVL